jgi:hypothetical protein
MEFNCDKWELCNYQVDKLPTTKFVLFLPFGVVRCAKYEFSCVGKARSMTSRVMFSGDDVNISLSQMQDLLKLCHAQGCRKN